jgi:hypothetical protein
MSTLHAPDLSPEHIAAIEALISPANEQRPSGYLVTSTLGLPSSQRPIGARSNNMIVILLERAVEATE